MKNPTWCLFFIRGTRECMPTLTAVMAGGAVTVGGGLRPQVTALCVEVKVREILSSSSSSRGQRGQRRIGENWHAQRQCLMDGTRREMHRTRDGRNEGHEGQRRPLWHDVVDEGGQILGKTSGGMLIKRENGGRRFAISTCTLHHAAPEGYDESIARVCSDRPRVHVNCIHTPLPWKLMRRSVKGLFDYYYFHFPPFFFFTTFPFSFVRRFPRLEIIGRELQIGAAIWHTYTCAYYQIPIYIKQ